MVAILSRGRWLKYIFDTMNCNTYTMHNLPNKARKNFWRSADGLFRLISLNGDSFCRIRWDFFLVILLITGQK